MKKALFAFSGLLLCALAGLAVIAARTESKIVANAYLGVIPVGGLTPEDASQKLDAWWSKAQAHTIRFLIPGGKVIVPLPLKECGLGLDKKQSIQQLPVAGLFDSAKQAVGASSGLQHFRIALTWLGTPKPLEKASVEEVIKPIPARVYYADGAFQRVPEKDGKTIDEAALGKNLMDAVANGQEDVKVPLKDQEPRVREADLEKIDEVVSTFTTKFPTRKKDRNTNIRIAAGKINGWVLLPGEEFSFNGVVGKRTIQDGFKTAPVYKNGKHDMGVGGGICQVSSTLYNAALFADLAIAERHNHSLPVAYLPVGRDATVDYGSLNLRLRNNLDTPIAISSEYEPGKLTFRILGKRDPSLSVKIESSDVQAWDNGTETVKDPSLPVGKTKVMDKGSRGHSLRTYRIVYKNGVQVARESLGRSYYKGGTRVIAVGTKPVASPPTAPALTPPLNSVAPAPVSTSGTR
jgi:vancomycin resistance protein YoaR